MLRSRGGGRLLDGSLLARGWHYTKISLSNVLLLLSFSDMCYVLLFLSFDLFLQTRIVLLGICCCVLHINRSGLNDTHLLLPCLMMYYFIFAVFMVSLHGD